MSILKDGQDKLINHKTIFFRFNFDEGKNWGFGHLNRSLSLYKNLRLINCKKILLINKTKFTSNFARKYLKKYKIQFIQKEKFSYYNKILSKNSLIIFDTLGQKTKIVFGLKKKFNSKIISLEDNSRSSDLADLVINSKIFLLKKKRNKKIYNNFKFMILKNEFKKRRFYKIKYKKNYKVLIASGGSDQKQMLYKYSKKILPLKNLEISVLIGPGVKRSNKIYKLSNVIKFIIKPKNVKKIIDKFDIVISSGGTFMFECICLGKIVVPIENYFHQSKIINYLKNKNVILKTPKKSKNFFKFIKKTIYEIQIKNKNYLALQKRAYNFIDPFGIDRSIKLIKNLIK
tara:strand:- start:8936 stop:9967 length:1032 start_codon:yes stop_codon:yes gene_type:complete